MNTLHLFLAQAAQNPATMPDFVQNMLLPFVPWVIIFLFIWFFVFRNQRRQTTVNDDYRERLYAHWAAVESKLDEIIELCRQGN